MEKISDLKIWSKKFLTIFIRNPTDNCPNCAVVCILPLQTDKSRRRRCQSYIFNRKKFSNLGAGRILKPLTPPPPPPLTPPSPPPLTSLTLLSKLTPTRLFAHKNLDRLTRRKIEPIRLHVMPNGSIWQGAQDPQLMQLFQFKFFYFEVRVNRLKNFDKKTICASLASFPSYVLAKSSSGRS